LNWPRIRPVPAVDRGDANVQAGQPQKLKLPTAPSPPIVVMTAENRPQPRLDAELGDGMT
jgi:hypothetical protein